MRWQTRQQHQAYPRLTGFLQDLPLYLFSEIRVLNAFKRFSGFNDSTARSVTTLGVRPLFQVSPIFIDGRRVPANGSHSRGLITIDLDIAVEIEGQQSLPEGAARVLLYATALHELVHYGRWHNGLGQTVRGNEAGKMFECTAYQGDINWDRQSSRLSQSRSGRYATVSWACPLSTLQSGTVRLSWLPPP